MIIHIDFKDKLITSGDMEVYYNVSGLYLEDASITKEFDTYYVRGNPIRFYFTDLDNYIKLSYFKENEEVIHKENIIYEKAKSYLFGLIKTKEETWVKPFSIIKVTNLRKEYILQGFSHCHISEP